jgi:hypothetical protein
MKPLLLKELNTGRTPVVPLAAKHAFYSVQ